MRTLRNSYALKEQHTHYTHILLLCQYLKDLQDIRYWCIMKRQNKSNMAVIMNSRNTKESNIDKKYREIIFQYSIEDIKVSKNTRVLKYEFPCPFCSAGRKGSKKKARCSALFWVENRGCFRFQCFNAGSGDCKASMEFPMFLERLNSALFRQYQWERYHSGTTGGRWNCAHPPEILNLMAGSGNA